MRQVYALARTAVPLRAQATIIQHRPKVNGKFLVVGNEEFYLRGVTYGTFRAAGETGQFPSRDIVRRDFRAMAESGINSVRTYTGLADDIERRGWHGTRKLERFLRRSPGMSRPCASQAPIRCTGSEDRADLIANCSIDKGVLSSRVFEMATV
jgi:hypothetical protein